MSINKKLLTAALAGLFSATVLAAGSANAQDPVQGNEGTPAEGTESAQEKHACKGLNSCKGNSPDGKNECKGKSECSTIEKHACKGLNSCKGNGPDGKNECKGKSECATDGSKAE